MTRQPMARRLVESSRPDPIDSWSRVLGLAAFLGALLAVPLAVIWLFGTGVVR